MIKTITTAFGALLFCVFVSGKLTPLFVQPKPANASKAQQAPTPPPPAQASGANVLYIPRDRSGHFNAVATMGGKRVDFMVDTGASIVALTYQDAQRLGITPGRRDRTIRLQTANGVVSAPQVRLAQVTVGSLTVYDVEGVVMPPGALSQNLLGMSFLSRLRRFEFRSGQLLLEQ